MNPPDADPAAAAPASPPAPAPTRWTVLHRSVRGVKHERNGKENQDAAACGSGPEGGTPILLAVADGHGAKESFRSGLGSRFAVEAALIELSTAVAEAGVATEGEATPEAIAAWLKEHWPERLLGAWRQRVRSHWSANRDPERVKTASALAAAREEAREAAASTVVEEASTKEAPATDSSAAAFPIATEPETPASSPAEGETAPVDKEAKTVTEPAAGNQPEERAEPERQPSSPAPAPASPEAVVAEPSSSAPATSAPDSAESAATPSSDPAPAPAPKTGSLNPALRGNPSPCPQTPPRPVVTPLSALPTDDEIYLTYGTTLLTAYIGERFAFFSQVGDGDLLLVDLHGRVTRPLPNDPRLFANETTSLCSRHAASVMRQVVLPFTSEEARPALILLSTDGYSNSFRDDAGFLQVGSDLLAIIKEDGLAQIESELESWLGDASRLGSGDDITLGLICRHPLPAAI